MNSLITLISIAAVGSAQMNMNQPPNSNLGSSVPAATSLGNNAGAVQGNIGPNSVAANGVAANGVAANGVAANGVAPNGAQQPSSMVRGGPNVLYGGAATKAVGMNPDLSQGAVRGYTQGMQDMNRFQNRRDKQVPQTPSRKSGKKFYTKVNKAGAAPIQDHLNGFNGFQKSMDNDGLEECDSSVGANMNSPSSVRNMTKNMGPSYHYITPAPIADVDACDDNLNTPQKHGMQEPIGYDQLTANQSPNMGPRMMQPVDQMGKKVFRNQNAELCNENGTPLSPQKEQLIPRMVARTNSESGMDWRTTTSIPVNSEDCDTSDSRQGRTGRNNRLNRVRGRANSAMNDRLGSNSDPNNRAGSNSDPNNRAGSNSDPNDRAGSNANGDNQRGQNMNDDNTNDDSTEGPVKGSRHLSPAEMLQLEQNTEQVPRSGRAVDNSFFRTRAPAE
jgi:hypothetical protein